MAKITVKKGGSKISLKTPKTKNYLRMKPKIYAPNPRYTA